MAQLFPSPQSAGSLHNLFMEMDKRRIGRLSRISMAAILVLCIVCCAIAVSVESKSSSEPRSTHTSPSPSLLGKYKTAAVSSDDAVCSCIGRDVMLDGGNAVDAAVAVIFCMGLAHPESAGIGGGFLMTVYNSTSGQSRCLNAREVAPLAASRDMFVGISSLSRSGGLAVAVPGEVAGSWAAHQAYGVLPWSRLLMPSVALAKRGIPVNFNLDYTLKEKQDSVEKEPSMSEFINPKTGKVLKKGDIVKRPQLAETLKMIATYGADVFYNGTIGDKLVADVQRRGGILTKEDLQLYRPEWVDPIRVNLKGNLTLSTFPPPGSGVLVAFVMSMLDGNLVPESEESSFSSASKDPLTYHRIAEAFKFAYAHRTKLGDPLFEPSVLELVANLTSKTFAEETYARINDSFTSNDPAHYGAVTYTPDDSGTTHISVLDKNGLAVSVTSTVNLVLGAGFSSEQTGILLNDQMDDFSSPNITNYFGVPPSPINFIAPGKRPLSSMSPSIVSDTQTGRVRMVIGAAGGTTITTSTTNTIIRHLWFGETIKEAIDSHRMHHQLFPMSVQYEEGFPQVVVNDMTARGHNTTATLSLAVVAGIAVGNDGLVYANSDFRKRGDVAGIDPVD